MSEFLEPREALCPGEALGLVPGLLAQTRKSGIGRAVATRPGSRLRPVSPVRTRERLLCPRPALPGPWAPWELGVPDKERGSSQETGGSPRGPAHSRLPPEWGPSCVLRKLHDTVMRTRGRVVSLAGARARGGRLTPCVQRTEQDAGAPSRRGGGANEAGTRDIRARAEPSNRE